LPKPNPGSTIRSSHGTPTATARSSARWRSAITSGSNVV